VSASQALREARDLGIELKVVGDDLLYRPKEALTDELRVALLEHKQVLMKLLAWEQRNLEEADRRGLASRWSDYPDWIDMRDPLSGQWYEVRAADCLPSIVNTANAHMNKGGTA
jgi:hypothetical protein